MTSSVLGHSSPHLMLHWSDPSYSFMRIFGCLCYPHLRPYSRHKINYRSSPCVFLGYLESFRGYRCMDLRTNEVYVCKHVRFDEHVFPFAHNTVLQPRVLSQHPPWSLATLHGTVANLLSSSRPTVAVASPTLHERVTVAGARPSTTASRQPTGHVHPMVTRSMSRSGGPPLVALAVKTYPAEPTCYTQAAQFSEWRGAIDLEFNALL